jgi:hypothetical protein
MMKVIQQFLEEQNPSISNIKTVVSMMPKLRYHQYQESGIDYTVQKSW